MQGCVVISRKSSIPVNEEAVSNALEQLKSQPGGLIGVSEAVLAQVGQTMERRDFEALKLDLADEQWLTRNRERLDEIQSEPPFRDRIRPLP